MKHTFLPLILLVIGWTGFIASADFPTARISNGLIEAELYLPDAQRGYYQGTRFDWSGVMPRLDYKGHSYFGIWNPPLMTPNCTMPLLAPLKNLWP